MEDLISRFGEDCDFSKAIRIVYEKDKTLDEKINLIAIQLDGCKFTDCKNIDDLVRRVERFCFTCIQYN